MGGGCFNDYDNCLDNKAKANIIASLMMTVLQTTAVIDRKIVY